MNRTLTLLRSNALELSARPRALAAMPLLRLRRLTRSVAYRGHRHAALVRIGFMCATLAVNGAMALSMQRPYAHLLMMTLMIVPGTGFALLAAHALARLRGQRRRIARLAAALERQCREGTRAALPPDGGAALDRLIQAINGTGRQAAEREAELLVVQAAYAHDLRTPLTRIGLRSEMLDDTAMRDAMAGDLAEMNELVEASLACARTQSGGLESPRRVDADRMFHALVDNYHDAGRVVELDGRVGRPIVTCPHALRRVLMNLIDNALRYGTDVRLRVRVEAQHLVLAVLDSGPGIAPSQLAAVFEPWYRAPESAAKAKGSGLGLAIARRLVKAMRGDLQLRNRRGGGLEATLRLPLVIA
ncbi:sensor histidine kinase [Burkholderia gladioli]|uniref:sensor histidine kinase n=1 Tax=Burkholderia gladioli TaxID=28095 RepID=UPI0016421DCA|nr:ATP-binding protein [Burkholderia gladioli]